MRNLILTSLSLIICILFVQIGCANAQDNQWLQFQPIQSNGKHIVLIGGDEEYRSEESLPMLAKILATHHGFKTTVLFSIDPATGNIDPTYQNNIPGLSNLTTADLIIIATRFRELPNEQMKYIDDYLKAGKPVIGLRTATHAFNFGNKMKDSPYAKYGYSSTQTGWEGGFGKQILGETWIAHHGEHGKEGARGLINGLSKSKGNPILNGVNDIWVPSDVYSIKELIADEEVLVWGQVTKGMTAESLGSWEKEIMPLAWIKSYSIESGKKGKVFTTTMGSSIDFLNEDLRRLVVNACYWAVDLSDKIPEKSNVQFVGTYEPLMFGFGTYKKGLKPNDYK
jgi:type 1 glutamine amidotransferase